MRLFLFALLVFSSTATISAQSTSVFISAHPDDWQLFMNPNAYHAVADSNHTVLFVHITAGDAGLAMANNYTLAREEGSKHAIRFIVNAAWPESGLGSNMNEQWITIGEHEILSYSYRNTITYFLRLPDGYIDGTGYEIHHFGSLQKLINGDIKQISTVDGKNTFTYIDLERILTILIKEHHNNGALNFHVADTDTSINPNDHSDHLNSSKLIQQLALSFTGSKLNLYTEYYSMHLPKNVFPTDYEISVGTWGVTASGLSDFGHHTTWDATHNAWLGKQYVRSYVVHN